MSDDWVKALGIDYGTVRIGLAVSDDLGLMAHPLKTVSGKKEDNPVESILEVIRDRSIDDIVIGLPLHSDGRESSMSRKVQNFVKQLRRELGTEFPIHLVDELRTTRHAHAKLIEAGRREKDIGAILDQAAAAEILQQWLDARVDLPPDLSVPE